MRTMPLRVKLVVALVVPMLIVTVLMGQQVANGLDERSVAAAQKSEAVRLAAVGRLADAIETEAVATSDASTAVDELADRRADVVGAFEALRSPSLGVDRAVIDRLNDHLGELSSARSVLGDDPAESSASLQRELSGDAATPGPIRNAFDELGRIPMVVMSEFSFAETALVDVGTARVLSDYELVERVRADHARELATVLRLSSVPSELLDGDVMMGLRSDVETSERSLELAVDLGSTDVATRLDAVLDAGDSAPYRLLRTSERLMAGDIRPPAGMDEPSRSGAAISAQYAAISADVIADLQSTADRVVLGATRSAIISLLVGVWLLVVTAILQRVLYVAIKSPVERLTERARRISTVELPDTVAAMLSGDVDSVTAVEPLIVESDDEIGQLVVALNEMHRTAIGLAADQAESRRVVADMFVNLGRRNQRLVNRLLNRLTALERDERDPDKLAGLYEIDHVATRMRRNAESLLVLAGAARSRRWDHPVDVYDVARGALSEVESYDRVQVDTVEGLEIHGDVVADLTHLLAELVENAVSFSPPGTMVDLVASRGPDGYLIEVVDCGVGMTDAQLAAANHRIRSAADEAETPSEFLGHYVIGRLAMRHGIVVELAQNPPGGVAARVVLPIGAVVPSTHELLEEFAESTRSLAVVPDMAEPDAPEPDVPEPVETTLHPDSPTDRDDADRFIAPPSIVPSAVFVAAPVIGLPGASPTSLRPVATLAELADPPRSGLFAPPEVSTAAPSIGSLDLAAAQTSANAAVDAALAVFGTARRTPGANLPITSLAANPLMTSFGPLPTFDGSLSSDDRDRVPSDLGEDRDSGSGRSQLTGFQLGTRRAEQEV